MEMLRCVYWYHLIAAENGNESYFITAETDKAQEILG